MTYPIPDPTSTAVAREAAWLETSTDSLPALLVSAGGPWQIVQAYWPGNHLRTKETGIYVTRTHISDDHPAAMRYRPQYAFKLLFRWPIRATGPGIAETEQANFDAAIGLALQRVRGIPPSLTTNADKTHGSRFLSVAEVPEEQPVLVVFDDPEVTIPAESALRASATYYADDNEFNG